MLNKNDWNQNVDTDLTERIAFYAYAFGYPMVGNELRR